jgi:CBS-domain-containing membrane protein
MPWMGKRATIRLLAWLRSAAHAARRSRALRVIGALIGIVLIVNGLLASGARLDLQQIVAVIGVSGLGRATLLTTLASSC